MCPKVLFPCGLLDGVIDVSFQPEQGTDGGEIAHFCNGSFAHALNLCGCDVMTTLCTPGSGCSE